MINLFVSVSSLKPNRSFRLPSFDKEGRSIVSKGKYKVVGKLLTRYKCIDIYTKDIIYIPLNSYVKIVV